MKLRIILVSVYLLITAALFITFDAEVDVWISFFANAMILGAITFYHLFFEKEFSPFLSAFIVFTFLFFLVAPMVQINSFTGENPRFMNNFFYKSQLAINANILIASFNVVFFLCYFLLKKSSFLMRVPEVKPSSIKILPLTIIVISVLTIVIFFASLSFVLDEIRRANWMYSPYSIMVLLGWKKVFFLVPFAGLLLCFQYFKKNKKRAVNLIVILATFTFLLVLLLWFKNPLTEKRNALGPIYICLLFLFLPKLLNNNVKMLFFLFFSMIIVFPLTAMFTHTRASFQEMLEEPGLLFEQLKGNGFASVFNTLHYDAFANIMATMDYVASNGLSYGYQLLSSLLFFVPRSIWQDKPLGTGQFIGDYLIKEYGFIYNNLSNPLVSEGYINFGIFGVIAAAIVLALIIVKLLSWFKSEDHLKKIMALYFAIHLIFLLRGDLANGFSFYVGTFIGVIIIPKLIEYFIKGIFQLSGAWKK